MTPFFTDLSRLNEDERIEVMAKIVREKLERIEFVVENQEKVDRYLEKLSRYGVAFVEQHEGPLHGSIAVVVGPRMQ